MALLTVHGAARRRLAPERGTVGLSLSARHADRATAVREVGALHERFATEARSLVERGVATHWSSTQLQMEARHRFPEDDPALRVEQVATTEVRVRFRDVPALSAWVLEAGSTAGVEIRGIDWTVTEQRRDQALREVRVEAVRDAQRRAEDYAGAIGGTGVRLAQLWEEGSRPSRGARAGGETFAIPSSLSTAVTPIELQPDDIVITAMITADFDVLMDVAGDSTAR